MLKQNIGVRTVSVAIVTVMLLAGASLLFSGNVKAWNIESDFGPATVTSGSDVDFYMDITNTGSKSMEITQVGMHFDWMDSGYYYFSSDVSSDNPYVLGSGDSATFYISGVPIPTGITTHTDHSVKFIVTAADPGFFSAWGSQYSNYYSSSVFVEEPTYTVSGTVTDTNTGDGISGATVTIGEYSATTDYDGSYTITGVEGGTYTITVEAGGYNSGTKTVTVNDDMEVDFQLNPTSSGGGGNNGGSSGITNGPRSSGGTGWLIPLVIIIIVVIIVVVAIMSSKKKKVPQPQVPPPFMGESNQEMQSTTNFCQYCGREIPQDATVCPYCGHKL